MSLSLYPIVKKIGEGGFSTTYLATNTLMPSHPYCVVKQLTPTSTDPQVQQLIKERFKQEAITLENLGRESNGTIPSLYAYFVEQGEFYLIQEYIDGQTLTERVQTQGLFTETQVRQLLIDILPILAYVHQRGIVHRDIKPENIMLCHRNNKPILIDFGAVKETMSTMKLASGNTTKSIVIGTPGFMPIEQMSGRPMFASDIYALGLTAIYLLTGKLPAEIETAPDSLNVSWQFLAPNISPQLIEVLNKAIEPSSRDRYKNAQEMLQDLNILLPPVTPSSTIVPPIPSGYEKTMYVPTTTFRNGSRQGNPLMAAILGVIIGCGLIGGFLVLGQNSSIKKYSQNKNNSKQNVINNNDLAARSNSNIINNYTSATDRSNLSSSKNTSDNTDDPVSKSTSATDLNNLSSKNIPTNIDDTINNSTPAPERNNLSSSKNIFTNTDDPVSKSTSATDRNNLSSSKNISTNTDDAINKSTPAPDRNNLSSKNISTNTDDAINKSTSATDRNNLSSSKNISTNTDDAINNSTSSTDRNNLSSSKNISNNTDDAINKSTSSTDRNNLSSSKNISTNTHKDPSDPVRDYYSNIQSRNYYDAWNSLPVDLQNNKSVHPNGYNSFLHWWSKQVTGVEVQQTNLVSQTERDAVVDVKIEYLLRKGKVAPHLIRYVLVKDDRTDDWVIQKIRLR